MRSNVATKKAIRRRTARQLVPIPHNGPALGGDQNDGLGAAIVPVVEPVGDGRLQIHRHVGVALIQQVEDTFRVCTRTGKKVFV